MDDFEKEEEKEEAELNCMVDEMQKRRDDELAVQAQLKLPVDAARRAKRETTKFRNVIPIDNLKSREYYPQCLNSFLWYLSQCSSPVYSEVTGFKADLIVRTKNMDNNCARAKSDFFKNLWNSQYDPEINDDPDDTSGQTSGQYYRSKTYLLKRRSNANIRSYGSSAESRLIRLFARPIVTATELRKSVGYSQQAVNNAKLLCKCCVGVSM